MNKPKIYSMSFAKVYPLYIAKAKKKNRSKAEVDQIIFWLTGYNKITLKAQIDNETNFESFFSQSPNLNPKRRLITGTICGVKIEEIKDPLMREIRYLDKLIDELARGKAIEKILK